MSMRWSYVGPLGPGGQLDWGQSAGANIPRSGTLPDIEDLSLYQAISRLVTDGAYDGQVIDHDAYGLKVNGADLRHIIELCYNLQPSMLKQPLIARYLEYADNLPPDEFVALVAVAM
jgi:hypothetical protein